MTQQVQEIKEDQVLDTRGQLCPMPVIKASIVFKPLPAGKIVKIICTDPGSKADFPAWAEATGHHLLRKEVMDGLFVYWIQKG